jgi:tRNA-splicing endonuclease subunit Sen34
MDDNEECDREEEKFLLFLNNNEIFVWDKEAVMKLRRKYRIVGSLVGSLPSKPRQNLVFSLPLVLLHEEARLLLDKNIARIVENDVPKPTQEEILKFQDERKGSIQKQMEKLEGLKEQKLADFAGIIEEGRQKVNRKRKIPSQGAGSSKVLCIESDTKQSCVGLVLDQDNVGSCRREYSDQVSESKDSHGLLKYSHDSTPDICTSESCEQFEDSPNSSKNSTKSNLQDSTLVCVSTTSKIPRTKDVSWKFPETEPEQARCKVFSDLWERGYFVTNGNKFGGDYLVYPGDPLRFHSHFIVKILPWEERLTGLDLVSVGRLGSTVKKTSVLASVDLSGKVIYTSVQWSGFV